MEAENQSAQSIANRVGRNTLWLIFGNIGSKVLSFILIIILARKLGDIDFGKFTFAQSFVQIFIMLMDLGIGFFLIREIARDKGKAAKLLGNAFALKITLSFFVFFLIAFSVGWLGYPKNTLVLVYLLSLHFIFISMYSIFSSVFIAYEKMKFNVLVDLFERALLLIFCAASLYLGFRLIAVGSLYCLASFLTLMLSAVLLRYKFLVKVRLELDRVFLYSLLQESLPIALGGIITALYFHSNTVILSKIKGDQIVGWYGSGFYPAFYIQLVSGAFLGSIYPVMSRLFKESPELLSRLYQKSFQLMLLFALPVSVGGYLTADKIMLFFYGQAYSNSIPVFRILILGTVFFCLNSLFGHLLVSINRQAVAMRIAGLVLVINIIFAFLLVGNLSHIGVSMAFVISGITGTFTSLIYLGCNNYRLKVLRPLAKAVLANLVMALALIIFKGMNVLILIFFAALIYGAMILATRYFSREDIVLLREFLKDIAKREGAHESV